ncbi:hypothetical protein NLG97_g6392 [Lecanicillium saksenae]|uniref:Uncharacterized protein n=1 Tax=Lecanicillium saksenae TaxID=468837 RepID=A0ACC1QPR8_9HYPO|nr:hypothetical protein NLG97_g6392 [Lecanicillium saksenae]
MFATWKYDRDTAEVQNIRLAYDPISARSSQHQACDRCHEKKSSCQTTTTHITPHLLNHAIASVEKKTAAIVASLAPTPASTIAVRHDALAGQRGLALETKHTGGGRPPAAPHPQGLPVVAPQVNLLVCRPVPLLHGTRRPRLQLAARLGHSSRRRQPYSLAASFGTISEAVTAKINNHVTRVTDKDLDGFLSKGDGAKALLFTDKGTTSALLRSIAIDYLGVISVAQIRNKESKAVAQFGIEKFPTLVLVPGEGQEPVVYDGELKKVDMVKFLSQAGEPNPDPAPAKAKAKGDKKKSKKEDKPKAEKAEKPKKKAEAKEEPAEEAEAGEDAPPAASTPEVVVIPTAATKQDVAESCLQPKSHTCILALVPGEATDDSKKLVDSLSYLNTKYIQGQRKVFPLIAIPDSIDDLSVIREKLATKHKVELVAINARRNWWRQYEGDFGAASVEAWVDAVRMGEGAKNKLPKGLVEAAEEPEPVKEEPKAEEEPQGEEPAEEATEEAPEEHDEL